MNHHRSFIVQSQVVYHRRRSTMRQFNLLVTVALCSAGLACSEDQPPTGNAMPMDEGMVDGATEMGPDANAMDASMDAAVDAQTPDSPCIIVGPNCEPGPPHNDVVGMVCANDGSDEEGYCTIDGMGTMVCARSANGGPCQSGQNQPTPVDAGTTPPPFDPGDGSLNIRAIDSNDPLAQFFAREMIVFGIRLVASANVPDEKLSHAGHIMAEYLDNDEDGEADDPPVIEAMQNRRAILVMFGTADELENSGIFDADIINQYWGQDLYADETAQPGRFDASLEEVLHLITTAGYEQVYPEAFGSQPGSLLTEAMDLARGGQFMSVPERYPEEAWYHYDDRTCDYRCMAVEYFYWALTTLLGAQDLPQRCAEIRVEWEPCTAEALEMVDPAIYALLTDPQYRLPTRLPDGRYEPGQ